MKKKMFWFSRLIYFLVGLSAVVSTIWAVTFNDFLAMPLWSIIAIILLIVGGLNWLIVFATGDREKDLFHFIEPKK